MSEGPAIIMGTKYDDGESISLASYSRASSRDNSPFTIGSALGLVKNELREVLSRESQRVPRSAPVARAAPKDEPSTELRSQKTAPSQIPSVAEWSVGDPPPPPQEAAAPVAARAADGDARRPSGPPLSLYVKASRRNEEDSQTSAVPVTVYLDLTPTLEALGGVACGALGVTATPRILSSPDFSLCYRHPVNRRTIIAQTDDDWRDAFHVGVAQGAGELHVLVDLPTGLLRRPDPRGDRGLARVAGDAESPAPRVMARVQPPRKIHWAANTHDYTLDSHLTRIDPKRERPPPPRLPPKPVSKKERRRRIANELQSRLCRAPPGA